jgi:hypothetical protein
MAFVKQFPVRITLSVESYDLLLEALKGNEEDYDGFIAEDAQALREKIERYGRRETDENGDDFVRLAFYENEGAKFIRQFIAAGKMATDYRELSNYCDTVAADTETEAR